METEITSKLEHVLDLRSQPTRFEVVQFRPGFVPFLVVERSKELSLAEFVGLRLKGIIVLDLVDVLARSGQEIKQFFQVTVATSERGPIRYPRPGSVIRLADDRWLGQFHPKARCVNNSKASYYNTILRPMSSSNDTSIRYSRMQKQVALEPFYPQQFEAPLLRYVLSSPQTNHQLQHLIQ